jgi:uncharacterized protein (TIGR02145 family)
MKELYRKMENALRGIGYGLLLTALSLTGCDDKDSEAPPAPEKGTVTDIQGNVYETVKVGNQWWMAENLKVTLYRDSSLIMKAQTDTAAWNNAQNGAWCLFEDNANAPGLLYNWYAVTNPAGLAPAGWHIPTDADWKELEEHLGMSASEADMVSWRGTNTGQKLKIESPEGWTQFDNIWAENESGFTALAGGCRLHDGKFAQPGLFATGFWWTATPSPGGEAWYRYLDYKNTGVFRSHVYKSYGMSIRCVKDK